MLTLISNCPKLWDFLKKMLNVKFYLYYYCCFYFNITLACAPVDQAKSKSLKTLHIVLQTVLFSGIIALKSTNTVAGAKIDSAWQAVMWPYGVSQLLHWCLKDLRSNISRAVFTHNDQSELYNISLITLTLLNRVSSWVHLAIFLF